jgi:hypothetical protein
MAKIIPKRVAENAAGDFYVEEGMCLRCCLPHDHAPELLNDRTQEFQQCYFRRQPANPLEVEHAIKALDVSEVCALRYGGNDPGILAILRKRGMNVLCDETPEGQAWVARTPQPASPKRRPWFGGLKAE